MLKRFFLILMALPLFLGAAADGPSVSELAKSARKAAIDGNKNLAIYYYLEALKQQPDRVDWRLWVAEALKKQGNDIQALAEARRVLRYESGNARALAIVEELTRPRVVKSKAEEQKQEDEEAVASVPFPERSTEVLPKALAAWIIGDPLKAAEVVNAHNLSVSQAQQIYYFFVPAGNLAIDGKKFLLTFEPAQALSLFSAINTDSRMIPVIKGSSLNINKVAPSEFQRVAVEIAAKVEAESRLTGVMFDFSSHDIRLHQLYAAVKAHTKKPLFAVGGERLTFKYIDVGVLKCFNFGAATEKGDVQQHVGMLADGRKVNANLKPDIEVFNGNVESNAGQYLKDARSQGGKAIIGIPFIATSREYESWAPTSGGTQTPNGMKMDDYIAGAIAWTEKSVQVRDETFLGLAIWAIHPDSGVQMEPDPNFYFPSLISKDWWERMKKPLINR